MNNERRQVLHFALELSICLLLLILFVAGILIVSRNGDAYGAAEIRKTARLLNAPHPQLILVGGSGLAFGIDSERLEQGTGLHTDNLGLYAGLRIDYLLSQAKEGIRPGDTVVVIPEYDILQGAPSANGFLVLEAMQADPSLGRFALGDTDTLISMVREFPGWFGTRVYSMLGRYVVPLFHAREETLYQRVYRASNFDSYGDMIGQLSESYRLPHADALAASSTADLDQKTLARLAEFAATERTQGVRVFFSWPALPRTVYEAHESRYDILGASYEAAVGSSSILGTQHDFIFDDATFFDTINHLVEPGRSERTKTLLRLLQKQLGDTSTH